MIGYPVRSIPCTILIIAALSSSAAAAVPARAAVSPPIGAGELLWRSPAGLVPLPVVDVRVSLRVTGVMVRGVVDQTFTNPTREVVEAVYVFPLPDRAAVDALEMRIGARRITAVVREREQARATYEKARSEGKKAALLDQERPNLFRSAVAGIRPGESIDVTLQYVEELDYEGGVFDLTFPLTYTPRYRPEESVSDPLRSGAFLPGRAATLPRASVEVHLEGGLPLESVRSVSHDIRVEEDGTGRRITLEGAPVLADRDFVLRFELAGGAIPGGAVFVEDRPEGRYALAMLIPPIGDTEPGWGLPTETLFVLDVSGSMAGPSIRQAKRALLRALEALRPGDTFNVMAFNDRSEVLGQQFLPASETELGDARRFIDGLRADGGTEILPALLRALRLMAEADPWPVRRIVLITDGAVSNEERVLSEVTGRLGECRLHLIGIGAAPNRFFMRRLALLGRGTQEIITSLAEVEARMNAFLGRIDRPVMTDLELAWEGATPESIYPETLPDLHAGEPLFVSIRLAPGSGETKAVLTGRLAGGSRGVDLRIVEGAPAGSGVATRWARARVDALLDRLRRGAAEAGIRRDVIDLARGFNLVTRYTSLVAVEEIPTTDGRWRSLPVPAALPDGSELFGMLPQGGTVAPLALRAGWILIAIGLSLTAFLLRRS